MSRRIGLPVPVDLDAGGLPCRFEWRGHVYRVRVISVWRLQDRWWDRERHSDRTYFRLLAADHQVFEVYREHTSAGLWILDRIQD